MEDKTKRGLTTKNTFIDEELNVRVDKSMIYGMDGIDHWVIIRWFFLKDRFDLDCVLQRAEAMEKRYTQLRELSVRIEVKGQSWHAFVL